MPEERVTSSRHQTVKALSGLRDLVLGGSVGPGERLSEVALAARLDVSRTPLRAALQKLEQEGLIVSLPSGGYQARRFTKEDVFDAIELRGVMEGTAARLAAERGVSATRLTSMVDVVSQLDEVVAVHPHPMDFERYAALNETFHELLAECTGSSLVARELERITRLPFASPNAFVGKELSLPAFQISLLVAQSQHKAIVQAISMREAGRAEALAREHARLARRNLDFVLEEQPQLREKMLALALLAG